MIELTPLEETVAGKQLIQQGMERGMETGMEKGQLVGQIRLIQRLLKRPRTPDESLSALDPGELKSMLANLEADLAKEAKWS
jgi:flagellar biosynthesis/type III secretory pathway protein FliH